MPPIEIPKAHYDDNVSPSWLPTSTSDGKHCKPIIRCNCGVAIGLALHHVHVDGSVTASFHHAAAHELQKDATGYFFMHKGKKYSTVPGCGWHVFLKLRDYDCGDFPPTE